MDQVVGMGKLCSCCCSRPNANELDISVRNNSDVAIAKVVPNQF
jgi:hypothetical protein